MEGTPAFTTFLKGVEEGAFETNITSTGTTTIQQSQRNVLRRNGLKALKDDLTALYEGFDIVETKDGIVIVAENPSFTFSWELKSTIKSVDYDPFIEADEYDAMIAKKEAKMAAKREAEAAKAKAMEERRAKKLEKVK